ncbi:MAG: hypothetical protein NTV86_16945 [Planctomycetota bacterium]|nr:hypothetical protein [Planctomycetota bacterium]
MSGRVAYLVAILAAAAAGCTSPLPPVEAWLADEMLTLTNRTAPPVDSAVYDRTRRRAELFAAANETIGFQIVVDAGATPFRGLRVSCSDFVGGGGARISASNVTFFRALPVPMSHYPAWYLRQSPEDRQGADWYDALIPLAPGEVEAVDAKERAVFWADLRVPRNALAGSYTGRIEVSAADGIPWQGHIQLEVYDVVLPDARPLAAVGAFDHQSLFAATVTRGGQPFRPTSLDRKDPAVRAGLIAMRQLMRLGHEHRLDLFDTRLRPVIKRDDRGRTKLDFEDYDAIVRPYLDGTAFDDKIGVSAWPIAISENWPSPGDYGGADAPEYAQAVEGLVRAWRTQYNSPLEIREKFFAWPYRGRVEEAAYAVQNRLAGLIRVTNPGMPILNRLPAAPPAMTGWSPPVALGDLTDIVATPSQWLAPQQGVAVKPELPLSGRWLCPGRVPYLPALALPASGVDVRAWAWFAAKYRCTGILLPDVLGWPGPGAADLSDPDALDARTSLFYPGAAYGRSEVLGSIRLKLLRRGLQDAAMLWVLRQRQAAPAADSIVQAMVHYAGADAVGDNYLDVRLGGWIRDRNAWTLARRLLAEEASLAVHGGRPSDRLRLLRAELAAVGEVRIDQARTRLTAAGPDALDVAVSLDLYNQLTQPVQAKVSWGELSGDFVPDPVGASILTLAPDAPGTAVLKARWRQMPLTDTGKVTLPLRVEVSGRPVRALRVDLPIVVAAPVRGTIRIDGDLNDWPEPTGSTAGEFRLVGGRPGEVQTPVLRRTSVQVAQDGEKLLLAFRCVEPDLAARVVQPGNQVRYDQLLPAGEDLVEVLLDPGQSAKSVEDLYHLIVKANGVTLAHRGLRTWPPLGKVDVWPVEATAAVGTWAGGWTVELSIPLSSFGPAGSSRLWGVNFMRFSPQGGEATSWAAVARHFYDPRNLGTMYVLPITLLH